MAELKKILYCTDFSANADNAFEVARRLAKEYGAHLLVLSVVSRGQGIGFSALESSELVYKADLRISLDDRYTSKAVGAASSVVLEGEPGRTIIDFAKKEAVDLIVVGARGAGASKGFLGGGSIADKVVKNSPVPVLVVPD